MRGGEARARLPLRAATLCALVAGAALLALLLSQKAYAGAPPALSYSGSTITCQYTNNVAAGRVFSSNASAWAVGPDGATVSLGVWRNYYGDGAPDAANPDTYGERRRLYIDTSPLLPGTTYTVTKGAAVSLGGDSYPAASITITTPGTPPAPSDPEPEPEPDPEPVEPPAGGDGGAQGSGGSSSTGGGADQGASGEAAADASAGSSASSPSTDSASGTESTLQSSSDASSLEAASSESAAAGESRAAGIGGGAVYLVGRAGATPGAQEAVPAEPVFSLLAITGLVCVAVAAAAAGATKRLVVWKRHLSKGVKHEG